MSSLGNKEVFAKNLQRLMSKQGIDRSQLCADLNFKYSTVSEWISANKYPRIDKIEMMANYFGVLKSELIEESKIPSENEKTAPPSEDDAVIQEILNIIKALPTEKKRKFLEAIKNLASM